MNIPAASACFISISFSRIISSSCFTSLSAKWSIAFALASGVEEFSSILASRAYYIRKIYIRYIVRVQYFSSLGLYLVQTML